MKDFVSPEVAPSAWDLHQRQQPTHLRRSAAYSVSAFHRLSPQLTLASHPNMPPKRAGRSTSRGRDRPYPDPEPDAVPEEEAEEQEPSPSSRTSQPTPRRLIVDNLGPPRRNSAPPTNNPPTNPQSAGLQNIQSAISRRLGYHSIEHGESETDAMRRMWAEALSRRPPPDHPSPSRHRRTLRQLYPARIRNNIVPQLLRRNNARTTAVENVCLTLC